MPEFLEAEISASALEPIIGDRLRSIDVRHEHACRGSAGDIAELIGASVTDIARRGKVVVLGFGDRSVAIRFGMTGRIVVDGRSPIDRLEYESGANDPAWDRVLLTFDEHDVSLRDQRVLGSIEVDADLSALGVDVTEVDAATLAQLLGARRRQLKALLLDQSVIAGLGNLLADEVLFAAGLSPRRATNELTPAEIDALHRACETVIDVQRTRGGSHTGDLFPHRHEGARCPTCEGSLVSATIGGRTSWSCASHQQ